MIIKKIVVGFVLILAAAHAVAQPQALPAGWSMIGNDTGAAVEPVAIFGNATTATTISPSVITIWTWNNLLSQWNFFAPSMTPQALSTYAASKGYGVLTTIVKGEGFWVNAKNAVSVDLAAPSPAIANYSGTWSGSYGGYALTYVVLQTGNSLSLTLTSPILPAGQTSTGVINGNTASVTTNNYATSGTSTVTILNGTTISAVQNSCTPKPGYVCLVPNGTTITFTKAVVVTAALLWGPALAVRQFGVFHAAVEKHLDRHGYSGLAMMS